jgi:adenylosuccinate synthase
LGLAVALKALETWLAVGVAVAIPLALVAFLRGGAAGATLVVKGVGVEAVVVVSGIACATRFASVHDGVVVALEALEAR